MAERGLGGHSTKGRISFDAEEAAKLQTKAYEHAERYRAMYAGYSEQTISSLQASARPYSNATCPPARPPRSSCSSARYPPSVLRPY